MASNATQELGPFGDALAGALGGIFSNAAVYPLDTVKTRIQATDSAKGKGKAGSLSIPVLLRKILKDEGVSGFYKGFGASMLNTFSMQYAYFFFYSFVRNSYLRRLSRSLKPGTKLPPLSTAVELLLGAAAGALAQIFTIPVSVIATRQQLAGPDKSDSSFMSVGREIIREDGVTGLWTGIKPGLVLTSNPAITYGVFERIKGVVSPDGRKLSPWGSFLLGALSKTLATVVTYPYIMAKVRLQARSGASDSRTGDIESANAQDGGTQRYSGAIDVLRKVFRQQGFTGWYQGMSAQITKAVLSQALLFMLKDQFEKYALMIMIIWRGAMQKRIEKII